MDDKPKSARRLKLEAQLRENLKRRKEQVRGRAAPPAARAEGAPDEDGGTPEAGGREDGDP